MQDLSVSRSHAIVGHYSVKRADHFVQFARVLEAAFELAL
jgi:hypothetical protein